MRFILSVLAAVAGLVMLVVGGLQFSEASKVTSITAAGVSQSGAPLIVVDGDELAVHAGTQHIVVGGEGRAVLAVGRADDVAAWIGDTRHERVVIDTAQQQDGGEPVTFVPVGSAVGAPDPAESDLWMEVHTGDVPIALDTVIAPGYALLIASDGTAPAPAELTVTWPIGGYAPWSGPLLVGGGLLLLAGLLLGLWAFLRRRRKRRDAELLPPEPLPVPVEAVAEPAAEPATWMVVPWHDVDEVPELELTPFEPESADDEPLHTDMITLPSAEERAAATTTGATAVEATAAEASVAEAAGDAAAAGALPEPPADDREPDDREPDKREPGDREPDVREPGDDPARPSAPTKSMPPGRRPRPLSRHRTLLPNL